LADEKNEKETDDNNKKLAEILVKNVLQKAQVQLRNESPEKHTAEQMSDEKKIYPERRFEENLQAMDLNEDNDNRYTTSPKKNLLKKSLSNQQLVDSFALNMHRIDKDVTRCDRNYWYFVSNDNLTKLKNIVYTYVYWINENVLC
jgi:hypothetical protein